MITRGYYIGAVIDELSVIATQVSMRNKLGLTDLTVLAENFFRDVINSIHGTSLMNLNSERSNAPGIDLGDEGSGLAVQVTATATSKKINDTLRKILPEQLGKYTQFVVLVIGKKQSSYSIDQENSNKLGFSAENDIWDLEKIARDVVGLDILSLEKLHSLIRSEIARLKVELEIADSEGKYPTSGYDLWENRAKPKVGDGAKFKKFVEDAIDNGTNLKESIRTLANRLSRLPRITREFLVMLISRREVGRSRRFDDPWVTLLLEKVT